MGIYSCGPTVYWNQHIGHMYAYVQWDCLVRSLNYFGYKTKWVMNLTDVGHLTSDEDLGVDKMEKGAEREGLSVWQIADKYIAQFRDSLELLNIHEPDVLCRATEHIPEQIELIGKIEKNGFAYKTKTGLVFDTEKFPAYADFAHLHLEDQNAGSRVSVDPKKKKPWDFLLWITNQPNHIMKWPSPWGVGFPGWHIECTAMSVKYLGENFDIHTGGKEHIPVHHTNEVAQAFGAFGHQTANFWLHNEWLLFDGQKVSKSLGNSILVSDLVARGFDPLSLRYLIMTTHYRTGLNFTWESLTGAQTALKRLRSIVRHMREDIQMKNSGYKPHDSILQEKKEIFKSFIGDDLGMPQALAFVWELIQNTKVHETEAYELIKDFDKVLGLKLIEENLKMIPENIQKLARKMNKARFFDKDFEKSDKIREEIKSFGFEVKNLENGVYVGGKDYYNQIFPFQ